ncbi:hypothetical protein PENANT_c079G01610 [Penicillium antarcticum]|uniref:Uncharacterized protein n=1 Tax=Penicillium antarcticum TaxID=416450 RepID=A0A1V6PP46_9EURO|nr:uncharacterized protein N7508_002054 [Penicillium antarcticum]KAJ5317546.1 hypothetical protein N7508_002054 [Penicillium antarcticum]OQD78798.1 hypothetical protein PENANT_c079G01610 [Penicillium antarcticum]
MSNFMHKVKEAVTDHDKDTARGFQADRDNQGTSNAPATESGMGQNRSHGVGSNNPYGSGSAYRDSKFNDTQSSADPPRTGLGYQGSRSGDGYTNVNAGPHDSNLANKMDPRVDSDRDNRATNPNAGPYESRMGNKMDPRVDSDMDNRATNPNAGPHESRMGNKMDPRVDSDMDNRATRGTMNQPSNTSSGVSSGMDNSATRGGGGAMNPPSNMGSGGLDNHETTEDDYKKSTQENRSQTQPQPGDYGNNPLTSEESHNTSTQEHKSHSATSHAMPCQTGMQGEQGFDKPGLDNRVDSGFGGSAAGGSSYTSGAREPTGAQNDDPLNKLGGRVTRSSDQANAGNQRGGY